MTFNGFTDSAAVDCARTAMFWMQDARRTREPGWRAQCVKKARYFWKCARDWQARREAGR